MSLLEIRNLRTHLRTPGGIARAVDGVDLKVFPGETVGLVGESGSGKSLLALSVLGLQPQGAEAIREGSVILWKGENLLEVSRGRMRTVRGGEMAMVFQEPMTALNPVYTIGDQVGEALRTHGRTSGRQETRGRVLALLGEVGMPNPPAQARSFPHQLSGGMRQRVMIAMALAGEPALLIADEPTTALDVTVQAQILALLRRIREDRGMALILISHDLRVVSRLCERVLVLYGGRVVEEGTTEAVLRRPKHPYTKGLLGSRLSIHDRRGRLRTIPGSVPEAAGWPSGCRFHPRCSESMPLCGKEEPELEGDASGRTAVRCWLLTQEGE